MNDEKNGDKRMRARFCMLLKLIGSALTALVLLSLFSILYQNTGVHISNPTGETDYVWLPHQLKTTATEEFSWNQMDGAGFNNAYPSSDEINILIMGSSHMEAANVAGDKNVAYLLNEAIPDMYSYNIGISGHTIYHCVNNLKSASGFLPPI